MYDGTLVESWEALVTFQQMIVLADDVGTIDITPNALSARTGIPIAIIKKGIAVLESDDENSRSPTQNGRRLERLDSHREWGWRIINYMQYRQLADHHEKKQADKIRIAKKREQEKINKTKPVAKCRKVSQDVASVADVAHTDTDTDTDIKKKGRFTPPSLNEVKHYCQTRHNQIDAEMFIDFYQSKDWMLGKNKIKDWKACIRTWEKRDKSQQSSPIDAI
jgi:hypothetical protein